MKRLDLYFCINVALCLVMAVVVGTSFIMGFRLPPGTGHSLSLLGYTRHEWGTLHSWTSVLLIVLVIVHVAVHWRWIRCALCLGTHTGVVVRWRRWAIILTAGVIVLILLLPWVFPTRATGGDEAHHGGRGYRGGRGGELHEPVSDDAQE